MGVKVKIMLPYEPNPAKKFGVKTPIPDNVIIHEPKVVEEEKEIRTAAEAPQAPVQPEPA